jgi:DNA invertase Pin-like site-specific DNA recombinase
MNARYIRTSSINQNEARQLLRKHENEIVFIDKISGAIPFYLREKAKLLIEEIKKGEIKNVSVSSIDRLGRNTIDVLQTIEFFTLNGVNLKVDNLGIESLVNNKENPVFKIIVAVLANISEMERQSLRERQLEGIEIAKKNGVYKGRIKGTTETSDEFLAKYKEVVKHIKLNKSLRDISSRCGVSLATVQKVKKYVNY